MAQATEAENVVKYQFTADDDDWDAWKDTVPRSKSLEQRILELIAADAEGRVLDSEAQEDLDEAREDLAYALEHREWGRVEDAARRLGAGDE